MRKRTGRAENKDRESEVGPQSSGPRFRSCSWPPGPRRREYELIQYLPATHNPQICTILDAYWFVFDFYKNISVCWREKSLILREKNYSKTGIRAFWKQKQLVRYTLGLRDPGQLTSRIDRMLAGPMLLGNLEHRAAVSIAQDPHRLIFGKSSNFHQFPRG